MFPFLHTCRVRSLLRFSFTVRINHRAIEEVLKVYTGKYRKRNFKQRVGRKFARAKIVELIDTVRMIPDR